jgi:hypothetical protein
MGAPVLLGSGGGVRALVRAAAGFFLGNRPPNNPVTNLPDRPPAARRQRARHEVARARATAASAASSRLGGQAQQVQQSALVADLCVCVWMCVCEW